MFQISTLPANLNPLDRGLLPNRYHLKEPFELCQIRICSRPGEIYPDSYVAILQGMTKGLLYYCGSFENMQADVAPDSRRLSLHMHDHYELLYILDGEITQNIDCYRHYYAKGSACLVCPDTAHSEEYVESTNALLLFFKLSPGYVQRLLSFPLHFASEDTQSRQRMSAFFREKQGFMDFIPREDQSSAAVYPAALLERAAREFMEPGPGASFILADCIDRLLLFLFDRTVFSNTPVALGSRAEQTLFQEIRSYMEAQGRRVSRAGLEDHFHYSGDYLYKIIRRYTGLSIHDFCTQLCMKRAVQMLSRSDVRVLEVAEALGYHNSTQFYRDFQEQYHMTPRQFRQKGNRTDDLR